MKEKIVIDTSVWIEYFKGKTKPLIEKINKYLENGEVAICGVILAELITGAKDISFQSKIMNLKYICEVIEEEIDNWIEAGILRKKISQKGENVNLIDCFIAAISMKNSYILWSYDKHFNIISKYTDLKLYKG